MHPQHFPVPEPPARSAELATGSHHALAGPEAAPDAHLPLRQSHGKVHGHGFGVSKYKGCERQFMNRGKVTVTPGLHFNFGAFIVKVTEGQRAVHSGGRQFGKETAEEEDIKERRLVGGRRAGSGHTRNVLMSSLQTQSAKQKKAGFSSPTIQSCIWLQIWD